MTTQLMLKWGLPPDASIAAMVKEAARPERATPFTPQVRQRDWGLNELRLPKRAEEHQGRGRTFVVREVPGRVLDLADALLLGVNPDAKSMCSLMATFAEFQKKNPKILGTDCQLMLFIIDIVVQGLKASSALTYLRTIVSGLRRAGSAVDSPLIGDTAKICQLILAGEETEHAVDVSEDDAWRLVDALDHNDKVTGFFMLTAGIRCADLVWLLAGDVRFLRMQIYFRRTKNHRTTGQRFSITVQPRKVYAELISWLQAKELGGRLFASGSDVAKFNAALKDAAEKTGLPEGITSYTLRRRFIHSVIENHTEGDKVEWLEVVKATGHYNLEVVRNSYGRKFENVL